MSLAHAETSKKINISPTSVRNIRKSNGLTGVMGYTFNSNHILSKSLHKFKTGKVFFKTGTRPLKVRWDGNELTDGMGI